MKRILVIGLCLVCLIYMLWGLAHMEAYCVFHPEIDTVFAPGFTEVEFNRISNGVPVTEVENKLGKPLLTFTNSAGLEEWLFTDDGKCRWGDFAWLWRSVVISNDAVISVEKSIRYD